MAAIAQLKALLGIDNTQYKAGVRDSEKATERFQKKLANVGRMIGTAFSVGAIITATRKLIDFASEIQHTADNLQVSTDTLQGLNAMALRYGVSVDVIGRALSKMLIAQDGVAKGEKRYADALAALNLDAETFINLDSAGALEAVGKAYSKASDQAGAFAAVSDLLGERIGPRLIAFMKDLGEVGLQTWINKVKEAGDLIDKELIAQLELLGTRNDQIMLRIQVGFAKFIDVIGRSAKAVGAFFGSIAGEDFSLSGYAKALVNPVHALKQVNAIRNRAMAAAADAAVTTQLEDPVLAIKKTGPKDYSDPSQMSSMADYKEAQRAAKEQANRERQEERREKQMQSVRDRFGDQIARLRERGVSAAGRGENPDELARIGGKVGFSRAGLGAADRELKLQQESFQVQQEIARLNREMSAALQDIRDNTGTGVV